MNSLPQAALWDFPPDSPAAKPVAEAADNTRSRPAPRLAVPRELAGWREPLAAMSLANLCLLKIWSLLLERGVSIPRSTYLASFVNLAVLSAAIWLVLALNRRSVEGQPVWVRALLAFLFLVALHSFLTVLFLNTAHTRARDAAYLAALALALSVLISRAMVKPLVTMLLATAPFVLMTVAQGGWRMYTVNPPAAPAPLAKRLPVKPGAPRVVWTIFDTWDYGVSYPDRAPSLRLPELDRIAREALFAENATSPGPETVLSVPELLGNTQDTLGARPNLFSRAREQGVNTGVVGWSFPYCNEFNPVLAACASFERNTDRNGLGTGVWEIARNQEKLLLEAEFRSPFGQLVATSTHARAYREWVPAAEETVADGGLSLVFLHAPIPHEPFFYDRTTGRDDLGDTPVAGLAGLRYRHYLDALELMDRTIGDLRRSMEASGVWNSTAVILTSDHPYAMRERVDGKPINPRVPFIVKLPGQKEGLRYAGHFKTVNTGNLVLAILRGEVSSRQDLVRWMEANQTS